MIKGSLAYPPNCPKCGLPIMGSTLYDPKTVCQCPVDWKKLAKAADKRANQLINLEKEAHKRTSKSKLHFGD